MVQIARSIDAIEEKIRDDGIVVLQHPDVWGQARMTRYRVDFEKYMLENLKFEETLSAVISRADRAALESQTAIGVSLTPGGKGGGVQVTNHSSDDSGKGQAALVNAAQQMIDKAKDKDGLNEFEKTETFKLLKDASSMFKTKDGPAIGLEPTVLLEEKKTFYDRLNQYRRQNFGDDNADAAGYNLYQFGMPVSILPGEKTHKDHGAQITITVRHDFGPEFLASTFRNFVINDVVDRLAPLVYEMIRDKAFIERYRDEFSAEGRKQRQELDSINLQISELRQKEKEAIDALQGKHDAALREQPTVEVSQNVLRDALPGNFAESRDAGTLVKKFGTPAGKAAFEVSAVTPWRPDVKFNPPPAPSGVPSVGSREWSRYVDEVRIYEAASKLTSQLKPGFKDFLTAVANTDGERKTWEEAELVLSNTRDKIRALRAQLDELVFKLNSRSFADSRVRDQEYPIAPSDLVDVLLKENVRALALACFEARQTKLVRAADVRAFLNHELSAAFDLLSGSCRDMAPVLSDTEFISLVNETIQARDYESLQTLYERRIRSLLPDFDRRSAKRDALRVTLAGRKNQGRDGQLDPLPEERPDAGQQARTERELDDRLMSLRVERPVGALCWAIVVDSALLNCRLRQELREFNGVSGFRLICDPERLFFHLPMPRVPGGDQRYETAQAVFEQYVRARWPIICFSLDPIADQQNIGDAFSRTRDLQVALALAFSAGRIGINQLLRYRRQLDYEAATIALNRTITAYVFGHETFGWRFAPRYQTPPQEATNVHVIANQILRGGPGRNYQMKNSKLEAGERELSAVVIMPSILQRVRMEITGNWWRLTDPDETTLNTAHMIEQGRRVVELRQALASACDNGRYREDDLARMAVKIDQLEAMLPMQTKTVAVPYGNTLGGFDIFKKGSSALAPVVVGHQGVDELTSESCRNAFLLFGRNFSIQDTTIVAGGQRVDKDDVDILSREVLRVRLPKNLEITTTTDGQKYVELHLGTPNGVSNRMLLPFSDSPVTTTTITNLVKEVSSRDAAVNWTRSVETKMVTGPRPKCDLDKDATTKTAGGDDDAGHAPHGGGQQQGGAGGQHQGGDDGGDGQQNGGQGKAAAKKGVDAPKKDAAKKAAPKADGDHGNAEKAEPKGASATPSRPAFREDDIERIAEATRRRPFAQTIIVPPPKEESKQAGHRRADSQVKQSSTMNAPPKRRTILDRLMHREGD